MPRCAVLNCKNYPGKKSMNKVVRYHVFPKNPKVLREWIKVCGEKEFDVEKDRICSEHFEESDYRLIDVLLNVPKNKRYLKEDAIPTVNVISTSSARLRREKIRIRRELVEEALRSYEQSQESTCIADQENLPVGAKERQNIKKGAPATKEFSQQTESTTTIQEKESKEVQTEPDVMCPRELRAIKAETELRRLKAKLKKLVKLENRSGFRETQLGNLFTPGQIRRMEEPNKQLHWSDEDLASAMALYCAGGRVYRILRKRGFPLPGPSTLRNSRARSRAVSSAAEDGTIPTSCGAPTPDHTYC